MTSIENKYACPKKIWTKFSAFEKQRYNKLVSELLWKELYSSKFRNYFEGIEVTAHNIACTLIWNNL